MVTVNAITAAEEAHLVGFLGSRFIDLPVPDGPLASFLPNWKVRRTRRGRLRGSYVYATLGAWQAAPESNHPIEFVALSPGANDRELVELLAMVTFLYLDPEYVVQEGSILDIGRPWIRGSSCDHLLVSLPYPFGPEFENLILDSLHVRYLWLLPITPQEAAYGRAAGIPALEEAFETAKIDAVEPKRASAIR
jgi:hypothetical protein